MNPNFSGPTHRRSSCRYAAEIKIETLATAAGAPRRSAEELRKLVGGIVEFVKSKGRGGAPSGEIKKTFPSITGAVGDFVSKCGGGAKLRKEGGRGASVRYFVD